MTSYDIYEEKTWLMNQQTSNQENKPGTPDW
jgi:hypothetical protein